MSDEQRPSSHQQKQPPLILEAASMLLVLAASYGFIRLFADPEPVIAAMGSALAASVLAAVLRRLGIPIALALPLSLAGLALVISQRFAPGTQQYGIIPTGATVDQLRELVTLGADEYRRVRAPILNQDSFVAGVMLASWSMATLTDWAAMRLRLAFEPVLPAVLIFAFAAVLGSGEYRVESTIVFGIAIIIWTVAQRWATMRNSFVWLAPDASRGPLSAVRTAAAFSVIALGAAFVLTPLLPGSDAEEIYSFRSTTAPTRSPITPFVEISQRLVEQSSVPLFTVQTDTPQYWRVSGLETYDGAGSVWTTSTAFTAAEGDLDQAEATAALTETVSYTVTIDNLTTGAVGEIWAPTAYSVAKVVDSSVELSWNQDNATLTIDGDDSASFNQGDFYTLESTISSFTPDQLRSATETPSPELASVYLDLPSNLNDRVASEASTIVAGKATAYDQALALQDYFRSFDYSTDLGPRSGDPISQFLDERIGFCQQFAGTYALMARSLGIPARVAIGYTWGDPVTGQANTYQIMGKHAHAWPEVWLGEYGWVAFEPTPNRGAPGGASHTGIDPSQDEATSSIDQSPDATTPPVTVQPVNPADIDGPEIVPGDPVPVPTVASRSWTPPRWLLVALALIVAYGVGVPLVRRLIAARRRLKANTPAAMVDLAWREATDELDRSLDLRRAPSETRNEFAARAGTDRRLDADPLVSLSSVATMVRYDPQRANTDAATTATESSRAIVGRVHERVKATTRWKREIDPRRLRR